MLYVSARKRIVQHLKSVLYFLLLLFVSNIEASEPSKVILKLGEKEDVVIAGVGKPHKIVEHPADEMFDMDVTKTMSFKGATLDFHRGSDGFYLYKLELTQSDYSYFDKRIFVGVNRATIENVLGAPSSTRFTSEFDVMHYNTKGFDGRLLFRLIDDVVVSIFVTEDWS